MAEGSVQRPSLATIFGNAPLVFMTLPLAATRSSALSVTSTEASSPEIQPLTTDATTVVQRPIATSRKIRQLKNRVA